MINHWVILFLGLQLSGLTVSPLVICIKKEGQSNHDLLQVESWFLCCSISFTRAKQRCTCCRQESVIFKSFILESLYVFSFSYTHLFIYKHNRNLWGKQQILTFKKPEGISLQKLLRTWMGDEFKEETGRNIISIFHFFIFSSKAWVKWGSPISSTLMPKGYFREYWETLIMYSVTFSFVISSVYFTNAPLNRLKSPLSKPAASQMLELLKHHFWTCLARCLWKDHWAV